MLREAFLSLSWSNGSPVRDWIRGNGDAGTLGLHSCGRSCKAIPTKRLSLSKEIWQRFFFQNVFATSPWKKRNAPRLRPRKKGRQTVMPRRLSLEDTRRWAPECIARRRGNTRCTTIETLGMGGLRGLGLGGGDNIGPQNCGLVLVSLNMSGTLGPQVSHNTQRRTKTGERRQEVRIASADASMPGFEYDSFCAFRVWEGSTNSRPKVRGSGRL